jgi:hypothetical protein
MLGQGNGCVLVSSTKDKSRGDEQQCDQRYPYALDASNTGMVAGAKEDRSERSDVGWLRTLQDPIQDVAFDRASVALDGRGEQREGRLPCGADREGRVGLRTSGSPGIGGAFRGRIGVAPVAQPVGGGREREAARVEAVRCSPSMREMAEMLGTFASSRPPLSASSGATRSHASLVISPCLTIFSPPVVVVGFWTRDTTASSIRRTDPSCRRSASRYRKRA